MSQPTTTTEYQVTTSATASTEGTTTILGDRTQTVTAAEVAAGKYLLESNRDAACRIAQRRRADRAQEALGAGYLLSVEVRRIEEY